MKSLISMSSLMVALALVSTARANLLINGGLESAIPPKQPDNLVYISPSLNSTALTGWTIESGTIDVVPNSYFESSEGNFSVDMIGTPGVASISQQFATLAATQYTMTFDFSPNPESGPLLERIFPKTLHAELVGQDGVTVLAFLDISESRGTRTRTDMQWSQRTLTFTTDGTLTTVRFRAVAPTNLPASITSDMLRTGPVLDNVIIELGAGGTIPEPASLGILGVAGVALLSRRRSAA